MQTALITGGAGGLGRALCHSLRARGWQVLVLDLPGPALRDMAGPGVHPLPCDLTDSAQVQDTCSRVLRDHPALDLIIYNAGITQIAPFEGSDLSAHRTVFEINYFGAITVAHHLLGAVRRARGTHLAISSVAGFSPLHHRSSYAASKHALEGFFGSLRSEEHPHGVECLICAPSFIATNPGNPDARPGGIARPGSASDGIDQMSARQAANIILSAYDARRPFTPVGRIATLSYWLNRLSPRLFRRQMEKHMSGQPEQ